MIFPSFVPLYSTRNLDDLRFCSCMVRSAFALMLQKVTRQESFRLGAIYKLFFPPLYHRTTEGI